MKSSRKGTNGGKDGIALWGGGEPGNPLFVKNSQGIMGKVRGERSAGAAPDMARPA